MPDISKEEKAVRSVEEASLEQKNAVLAPEDEGSGHVSLSTMMVVFFMGLSYVPAISTGLLLPTGILHHIGQSLGDTRNIIWIPGGWSAASAVSFSIAGPLSDIYGRRWVLMSGQALTLIGSILSATASQTTTVAAGTTIIGFGAGMVFVSYPGIMELLPNKYRGIGLGWTEFAINAPWGCMSVYLATQLSVHASWRWTYYIGIVYSSVVITGTFFFYFPPSRPQHDAQKSWWQEFTELDFAGLALFSAGLTTFLIGITYLGHTDHSIPLIASTITIGAAVFAACFVFDFMVSSNPIFPPKLFAMFREFTVHLIILFVSGMVWQAVVTLGPQGTLLMLTSDPIQIGLTQMPSSFSGVLGGWILPSLVHKIKHIRLQIIFALLVQTIFTAGYAAVVPDNRTAWMAMQFFGQSCFTWVTTLAYVATGLLVAQEQLGVSAGLIGTFRSAGGSVGNAVFSSIMTSVVNSQLDNNIAAAAVGAGYPPAEVGRLIPAVIQNAVGIPEALASMSDATAEVVSATARALKDTYAHAFRVVFYSTIPFSVLALAAAWFVRDPSHLLNNHVAVRQKK